jgi:alkaline phosphatase D
MLLHDRADGRIKVEAKGLKPFTQYYYQFSVCGASDKTSPLGRTKTSPAPDDDVSQVGLAVYSCSNYPNGYFNAYGNAARKDKVDYVVCLHIYLIRVRLRQCVESTERCGGVSLGKPF